VRNDIVTERLRNGFDFGTGEEQFFCQRLPAKGGVERVADELVDWRLRFNDLPGIFGRPQSLTTTRRNRSALVSLDFNLRYEASEGVGAGQPTRILSHLSRRHDRLVAVVNLRTTRRVQVGRNRGGANSNCSCDCGELCRPVATTKLVDV
jgi:hypothetical protein